MILSIWHLSISEMNAAILYFVAESSESCLTSQAAMRLRQLGSSQAVVFLAPPEVDQSILDHRGKDRATKNIDSFDVICWLLEMTCQQLSQMQPLYYAQGTDFCRRTQSAYENADFLVDTRLRDAYVGAIRAREEQTLEELYKPRSRLDASLNKSDFHPGLAEYVEQLSICRKAFQDAGVAVHGSALQQVEQEREVAHEVETVRESQKPVHHAPLSFPGLHRDIAQSVETGQFTIRGAAVEHWITAMKRTAVGHKHGIDARDVTSRLFLSTEFSRTVSLPSGRPNNNFLVSR